MNKFEEAESGDGIESRAGFIEDEQGWLGDESSGDEDALAFALGEDVPGAIGEVGGFDLGKEIEGEADGEVKSDEVGHGITWDDKSDLGAAGGEDEGFAWSEGDLAEVDGEAEGE